MKTTKFLTMVLVANFIIAVAMGWPLANKLLVIINALAVLLLIALQFVPRKD